jgi:hypothetical protein
MANATMMARRITYSNLLCGLKGCSKIIYVLASTCPCCNMHERPVHIAMRRNGYRRWKVHDRQRKRTRMLITRRFD